MTQIKSANVEYGFDPRRYWISASVGQTISSCEGERSSKYSFLMPYRRPRWLQFFTLFVRCFWFKSSHTFSITSKSSIKSFSKESSETITKIVYIMFSLLQYYYLFNKFVHLIVYLNLMKYLYMQLWFNHYDQLSASSVTCIKYAMLINTRREISYLQAAMYCSIYWAILKK